MLKKNKPKTGETLREEATLAFLLIRETPHFGVSFMFILQIILIKNNSFKKAWGGFPGGAVVENLPANAGDTGSSPGLGRSHMPRSN